MPTEIDFVISECISQMQDYPSCSLGWVVADAGEAKVRMEQFIAKFDAKGIKYHLRRVEMRLGVMNGGHLRFFLFRGEAIRSFKLDRLIFELPYAVRYLPAVLRADGKAQVLVPKMCDVRFV